MPRAWLAAVVLAAAPLAGAEPLIGSLRPGEVQRHTLSAPAGRFLKLTVRKEGAEVALRLLGPGGELLVETSTLVFPPGPASFTHVAADPATYVLELRMLAALGSSRYTIDVVERDATDQDAAHLAAERAFLQGELRRIEGSKASLEQAARDLERALALNNASDAALEADTLTVLARARDAQGDKPAAQQLYDRALALHRRSGRESALANTLTYVALLYEHLGQRDRALETLREAAALAEHCGDRRALGLALNNTGLVQYYLGRKQEALASYDQALPHHRAAGNLRGEANTLSGIASVLDSSGQKQRALQIMREALTVREAAGDRRDLAGLLNNFGYTYASIDEVGEALSYYQRALEAWRDVGDQTGEAATLHNLASLHEAAGEYQQALGLWGQALPLFRATSAQARAAATLSNLGGLYVALGDPGQALPLLEEALATQRAAGNRGFEAGALANLGAARAAAGDHEAALRLHEQALVIRRELKDTAAEAGSLRDIARAQAERGAHEQALVLLEQSQALYRAVPRRRGEAGVLVDVARSRLALGDRHGALQAAETALSLYREVGNPRGEASALLAAAQTEAAEERFASARARLETAIGLLEGLRAGLAAPELRASFQASVQDYYELLIDVLMQLQRREPGQGFDAAALEVAERAHARGLLDVLAEARAGIREGVDPALLERERVLRRALNAKAARQARLWAGKASDEEAAALQREIDGLTGELRSFQAELRQRSPRYAELVQPRLLSVADIRQQVLDAGTLLLEYALGDQRSYVWAVSRDGIESYELPGRARIEASARRFHDELRRAGGRPAAAGRELGELLLGPLRARLGRQRLFVVPDGALHLVPIAALPQADGRPLVVRHEVVTLSSASTLAALRAEGFPRAAGSGVVAVLADPVFELDDPRVRARLKRRRKAAGTRGDPPDLDAPWTGPPARLIGSRREAEAILARAPREASLRALDFDANRATATGDRLAHYRIVHFATHGLVDHAHPELSGLVLSLVDPAGRPQDGVLRLHDVYNLRLAAELVVLSACQTALGPNVRGEGLIGLTRGFLYAGARSVLATLWRVDDAATAELMRRFYEAMLGPRGLRPAAALRAAQAQLAADPRWAEPYHWAGFVLQGEWR